MTRVRMRTSYAGPLGRYQAHEIVDTDSQTAAVLIAGAWADELETPGSEAPQRGADRLDRAKEKR